MAIAIQFLFTECARTTCDIEGYDHVITLFKAVHRGPRFFNHADKLMAKRRPHTRVGDHSMVQMQVRTANAGARNAHDSIIGMQDFGIGLVIHTDAARTAVIHCQHNQLFNVQIPTQVYTSRKMTDSCPNCWHNLEIKFMLGPSVSAATNYSWGRPQNFVTVSSTICFNTSTSKGLARKVSAPAFSASCLTSRLAEK